MSSGGLSGRDQARRKATVFARRATIVLHVIAELRGTSNTQNLATSLLSSPSHRPSRGLIAAVITTFVRPRRAYRELTILVMSLDVESYLPVPSLRQGAGVAGISSGAERRHNSCFIERLWVVGLGWSSVFLPLLDNFIVIVIVILVLFLNIHIYGLPYASTCVSIS